MSILVVRAFARFRSILVTHAQLAAKFTELEQKYAAHDKHIVDLCRSQICGIFYN